MNNIEQHIANLLQQFDCVILPEFGGFIADVEPGRFDEKSDVFYPPYKRILFNKNLVNNDGLLANELVDKESISYTKANELLNEYKNHCFARLNNEGRIEIERVGVLFFDQEKNLQFQQSTKNLLVGSFGLTPKYLNPLPVVKQIEPVKTVVPITKTEEKAVNRPSVAPVKQSKAKNRKRLAYIPLIAVSLILGGLFFANQSGYIGSSKLQLANLNPFKGNSIAQYQPRVVAVELVPVEDVISPVPVKETEVVDTKAKIDSTYYHIEKPVLVKLLKYHVIGGCFSSEQNANTLVSTWETKGNEAHIVDKHKSLYRVSIQSFATRSEANAFKADLKNNQDMNTWVLKK